jgi:hypothetical protein
VVVVVAETGEIKTWLPWDIAADARIAASSVKGFLIFGWCAESLSTHFISGILWA